MSEQQEFLDNPEPPLGTPGHDAWVASGGHNNRVPVSEERLIEHYFDMIYAHTITRDQNFEELNKVADKLKDIWNRFDNKQIESAQYLAELNTFKTIDMLTEYLTDDLTRVCFTETITKLESEANA
jgi:hypothetical protein